MGFRRRNLHKSQQEGEEQNVFEERDDPESLSRRKGLVLKPRRGNSTIDWVLPAAGSVILLVVAWFVLFKSLRG